MRRLFLFGAAAIALGASGTQSAPPPVDSTEVFQIPDTMIVTANRFGLASANCVWPTAMVPQNRLTQSSTLSEALSVGTGVDLRDYTGTGSVATLSNWGTYNRHMLLLYDGRVVRDYSLGGFNLSEYSPSEFDRVELLKGPQSAFYGSDALGGVVNLVPRNMLADRMEISSQVGSFAYQRHRIAASRKVGQIGIGGWGELLKSDNDRPNAGVEASSYGLRTDALSFDGRLKFHATARSFVDSLGSPGPMPALGEIPPLGNSESSNLFDHQKDRNFSVDAHFGWQATRKTDLQFDAFFDHKRLTYRSRFEESWIVPVDTAQTNTVYRKRSSGITGRVQQQLNKAIVAGGVDWLYGSLDYQNEQQSPSAPLPDRWTGNQHQFDVWSAVSAEMFRGIRPDLSGRLSFVKDRAVQSSYNAGCVVAISHDVRVKFGYGFAYRIPSLADQFGEDAYTRGNPNLRSERTRSLVTTVSHSSQDHRTTAHVTGFSQRTTDLIQYQYDGSVFQYVPKNVNRFSSIGVDAGVQFDMTKRLSCNLTGVWQRARQTLDSTYRYVDAYYVPDLTWTASVEYAASRRIACGADLRYLSDRWIQMYGDVGKTIQRVYEVSMHVRTQISSHFELTGSIEDITDQKRPSTFGYTISDRDYPSPGRRFVLRLTARIGR